MKNSLDVEQIGGTKYPIAWKPEYGDMPKCTLKTHYKKDEILIYNKEGKELTKIQVTKKDGTPCKLQGKQASSGLFRSKE